MARKEDPYSVPRVKSRQSLYVFLHDAVLHDIVHIDVERVLRLNLELGFPRQSIPIPDRVDLVVHEVSHAYVHVWKSWSGSKPVKTDQTDESWQQEWKAYFEKGHFETMGLTEFAEFNKSNRLEVMDASLGTAKNRIVLGLDVISNFGIASADIQIAGRSLTCLADGSPIELNELMRLGKLGWDEWAAGNK